MFTNLVTFVVKNKTTIIKAASWILTAVGVVGCVKAGAEAKAEMDEAEENGAKLTGGDKAAIVIKHCAAPAAMVAGGLVGNAVAYRIDLAAAMKKNAELAMQLTALTGAAKNLEQQIVDMKTAVKENVDEETAKKINGTATAKAIERSEQVANGGINRPASSEEIRRQWTVPCADPVLFLPYKDDEEGSRLKAAVKKVINDPLLNGEGVGTLAPWYDVLLELGIENPPDAAYAFAYCAEMLPYKGVEIGTSDAVCTSILLNGRSYKVFDLPLRPMIDGSYHRIISR